MKLTEVFPNILTRTARAINLQLPAKQREKPVVWLGFHIFRHVSMAYEIPEPRCYTVS